VPSKVVASTGDKTGRPAEKEIAAFPVLNIGLSANCRKIFILPKKLRLINAKSGAKEHIFGEI